MVTLAKRRIVLSGGGGSKASYSVPHWNRLISTKRFSIQCCQCLLFLVPFTRPSCTRYYVPFQEHFFTFKTECYNLHYLWKFLKYVRTETVLLQAQRILRRASALTSTRRTLPLYVGTGRTLRLKSLYVSSFWAFCYLYEFSICMFKIAVRQDCLSSCLITCFVVICSLSF